MKIFRSILLILTLNCEQSAKLYCEAFERKLSLSERIAVTCHHAICRSSRELARQLKAMETTLRAHPGLLATADQEITEQMSLSSAARQRMRKALTQIDDTETDPADTNPPDTNEAP